MPEQEGSAMSLLVYVFDKLVVEFFKPLFTC